MKVTMKRKTDKYLLMLILALGLFLTGQTSFAQCELKFDYTVEDCSKGQKDGKIYLTVSGGEVQSCTFKIIDMYSGKNEFMKDRKLNIIPGQKMLVFDNLEASNYRIQIISPRCKVTIGGIEGIVVTQNDK